jgi:hypothetical protein
MTTPSFPCEVFVDRVGREGQCVGVRRRFRIQRRTKILYKFHSLGGCGLPSFPKRPFQMDSNAERVTCSLNAGGDSSPRTWPKSGSKLFIKAESKTGGDIATLNAQSSRPRKPSEPPSALREQSANRVTTGNRFRRPAGEGMAQERVKPPCLIGAAVMRQSRRVCEKRPV